MVLVPETMTELNPIPHHIARLTEKSHGVLKDSGLTVDQKAALYDQVLVELMGMIREYQRQKQCPSDLPTIQNKNHGAENTPLQAVQQRPAKPNLRKTELQALVGTEEFEDAVEELPPPPPPKRIRKPRVKKEPATPTRQSERLKQKALDAWGE